MAANQTDLKGMRARYMECRRKCKKLHKAQVRLRKEIDHVAPLAANGDVASDSALLELMGLSEKSATLMHLLQIDAWEARRECERHQVKVPSRHRSEGEGFDAADPSALDELRQRLSDQSDADTAALMRQGV